MTCDCKSYNGDFGTTPEVILDAPKWLTHKETVCIDFCISGLIQSMWDDGIVTLSSCCGHNKETISIVFESAGMAVRARRFVNIKESRRVECHFWGLVRL